MVLVILFIENVKLFIYFLPLNWASGLRLGSFQMSAKGKEKEKDKEEPPSGNCACSSRTEHVDKVVAFPEKCYRNGWAAIWTTWRQPAVLEN